MDPASLIAGPTEARIRLGRELEQVAQPEWASSADRIANTIWSYQMLGPLVPADLRDRVYGVAGARYPGGFERWEKLFALPEQVDVSRAIAFDLAKPKGEPDREPGDEVFPTDGWLGDYIRWTDGSPAPVAYRFWSAVATLGAACRRTVYLDMGHFEIYPAYLIILAGTSGIGKGVALKAMQDVVDRVNRKIEERADELFLTKQVADPFDKRLRTLYQNVTPESLIDSLKVTGQSRKGLSQVDHPWYDSTGVFLLRELDSLLGKDNFHHGKMVSFLLDMYDCPRDHDASTIRRGEAFLWHPTITLVGCTTPRWIRNNLTEDLFLEGLVGRFTFAYREMPEERPRYSRARDPLLAEELADRLLPLALGERRRSFLLDQQVEQWHEDAKDRCWKRALLDQQKRGYYLRLPGHILRLAIILALSRSYDSSIHLEDVELAEQILSMEGRYIEACLRQVGSTEGADLVPLVVQKLHQAGGQLQHTALFRLVHHRISTATEFHKVVLTAKEMGYLEIGQSSPAQGRKAVVYTITPEGKEVR